MEKGSFKVAKEDVGSVMLIAGDSSPAIASLEPRIMSAGLNAGGDNGEVKVGNKVSASLRVEIARRCILFE